MPNLTPDQQRFLALHADPRDPPMCWRWHFRESVLRAYTDAGRTATIARDQLAALLQAGVVEMIGCAGVRLRGAA